MMPAGMSAAAMMPAAATRMSATRMSAATTTAARVTAAAMRVDRAHRECQAAPDGHCAEKFPHDAAPYAFQM